MVVSVLVTFFVEILKRFSSIVKSDHSNCSHQAQLTTSERFRGKKRMLSQKERAESEVLAWRGALYCKEKNAVIEKAHGKELLSSAFLPKSNVENTHHLVALSQ